MRLFFIAIIIGVFSLPSFSVAKGVKKNKRSVKQVQKSLPDQQEVVEEIIVLESQEEESLEDNLWGEVFHQESEKVIQEPEPEPEVHDITTSIEKKKKILYKKFLKEKKSFKSKSLQQNDALSLEVKTP